MVEGKGEVDELLYKIYAKYNTNWNHSTAMILEENKLVLFKNIAFYVNF